MREITVNSETFLLLDDLPEFSRGIKLDVLSLDDVVDGITRVEERTSLAGFRLKVSQVIEIQGNAEVAAANSFLANLEDGRVALPLWGLAQDGGAGIYQEPAVTPAKAVYFTGWGRDFVVVSDWDAFGTPQPGELKVPLVFGRIQKIRSSSETGSRLTLQIDFMEDADPSLGISYEGDGSEFPGGLTTSKGSQKLMPFSPDWGSQTTGAAQVEVISKEIGFRKESSLAYYSQQPIMPLGFRHYFQDSFSASELIAFFMHHQGRVKGFWTPTWAPCIFANAPVLSGTSSIPFDEDPSTYFPDDKICIVRSRDQIITREITSISFLAGSWWIFLDSTLPWTLSTSDVICPAAFARFKSPRLSIRFRANGQASSTLNLVTLPVEKESALPTGETVETYGDQASRVIAYRFAERDPEDGNLVPNADLVADPTNFSDVAINGTGGSFSHTGGLDGAGAAQVPSTAWITLSGLNLSSSTQVEIEIILKSLGTTTWKFEIGAPVKTELWTETDWAGSEFRKYRRTVTLPADATSFNLDCVSGSDLVVDSIRIRKAPVNAWHFTSHQIDLVDADDPSTTWQSQPMDHGSTSQALNMDTSSLTLESRTFDGNPLGIFSNFDIQHELEVEVIEGVKEGDSTFSGSRVIFLGRIDGVDFNGAFITAKARSVGTLFDRKVPTMMVQKTCNWALFSTPCGLAKASWQKAGTMDVADGESVITCIFSEALAAGWLRGGWIEITTASRVIRATILDSTVTTDLGGGSYQADLSLAHPVTAAQDSAVLAFPGCDGHHGTCSTKFSNFSNFGGFPFIPANNPTMLKVSKNVTAGGKK